jgi:cysteine desulfurase
MDAHSNNIAGFFDYASATPLDPIVLEAMQPFLSYKFYNPSALYAAANGPKIAIADSRSKVAAVLGVKANEIIFTAGCTEANNIAIHGVMTKYPDKKILISAIEHDSVSVPAAKYNSANIPVNKHGELDLSMLENMIDNDVVLVSVIYASNEIGSVQDLRSISKVLAAKRSSRTNGLPLYLHTDAAQAANYLTLNCHSLGVDMMSLNGGKMYGPKASGCLYISKEVSLEPLVLGGGQERGMRSGTENVAAIVGFAEALQIASESILTEVPRQTELRKALTESLDLDVVVSPKQYLPNIISLYLGEYDAERMVMELDKRGFQVSSGSACHARSGVPSAVLNAISLSDQKARSVIRISMGRHTARKDVQNLAASMAQILALG